MANRWRFSSVFQQHFTKWSEVEDAISAVANTKEKGDAFEQFCYFYFLFFKDLYNIDELWSDKVRGRAIPYGIRTKYKIEKKDFGIDGASRLKTGQLEAWQGKFRSGRLSPTFAELATFWAEAEYADFRRVIANSSTLPSVASKKKGHQQTLVDSFLTLDESFFIALWKFANTSDESIIKQKSIPRPHQRTIIENVVRGLQHIDRGKLIAAPAIGKTLTSLWIAEHPSLKVRRVLFLVPSIALVGQALREWTLNYNEPFTYLCVCSDPTVTDMVEEHFDISTDELGFYVTTDVSEIKSWLAKEGDERKYLFSTYQSVEVVERAIRELGVYQFDLMIFDEAHRTVGRSDQLFAVALQDSRIRARKRLFMTATERIVNPALRKIAKTRGIEIFSMSDEGTYGPILYEYQFGKAIEDGVIADYELILAAVSDTGTKAISEQNRLVAVRPPGGADFIELTGEMLFKATFLIKTMIEGKVSKTITFHSLRGRAIAFSKTLETFFTQQSAGSTELPNIAYILGNQSAAERAGIIERFEKSNLAVLSNVQVLSEGVNIPIIDSVYFVDPKSSVIDIVQAIGRALRKPYGSDKKKVARVIIPMIIPPETKSLDQVNWDQVLETFHYVIQAMRAQDKRLEEEINQINLYSATGGNKGRRIGSGGRISVSFGSGLDVREEINIASFLEHINIRVATVNANPEGSKEGYSHLGKGQRKLTFEPEFVILGDFNPDIFLNTLIRPTISKFKEIDMEIEPKLLKVNHNNVSHTERLGLIAKGGNGKMRLTRIGKMYWNSEITFEEVFRNQMMLFATPTGLFPYRIILQILMELGHLYYIEFLYGPYIIQSNSQFDLAAAINRIRQIRSKYPQIHLTSIANRESVRKSLNALAGTDFPDKAVWSDRSTLGNRFRYLKNQMALDDLIQGGGTSFRTPLVLPKEGLGRAKEILQLAVADSDSTKYYGERCWIKKAGVV